MMENKAENKLDFSLISKYRAILMGVAIIMIIWACVSRFFRTIGDLKCIGGFSHDSHQSG